MRKLNLLLIFALIPGVIFLPKNSTSKVIFLTFDADMTYRMRQEQEIGIVKQWYDQELMDYLVKNSIPATFFVTGMFADMYPDLVRSLASNPNFSIQNHTYDHKAFEPNCFNLPVVSSDNAKRLEIKRTQNIIKSLTGRPPTYFRYPGLCHNAHDDDLVAAEGLSIVHGQISSGDAYLQDPKAIVRNIMDNLKHGQVIIFHLGTVKTPGTLAALKLLVPKLKDSDYKLDRL